MANKKIQKSLDEIKEQLQNQESWRVSHAVPPMAQAFPDNCENSEAIEKDEYRLEAYAQVESWVSAKLQLELDKIQKNYDKLLDKDKKTLKRYEHKLNEYSGEIRFMKHEIKCMNKKITLLEDKNKTIKTILKRIGFYVGVSAPNSSLKEVSKDFKHESRKISKYDSFAKKKKRK